ncbi:MAG: MFS transporter [Bryobacterales bacterium]|nr:MFS transporter [Bryobacteraceae bacterium]MDW8131843.1 MFS transporter [Bryobacterales bacterium]
MRLNPVSPGAYWRLVRDNRNFRLLWLAQIVSELGDWFYAIAIYSLLLELTGSAKAIALAYVLQVLPQVFVAPAAGVVNDRMSRKRVMILTDLACSVIVLGMLLVRSPGMVWLAYVLLLLETVMWAFFEPGRSAVVPVIAREQELLAANTLASMTWSFNLAVGASLGGLVAAFLGRDSVFLINAVSFVASAALIRSMCFRETHLGQVGPFRLRELTDFSPVLEGARYMVQDRRRLATLLVKGGLGLMGTNWVLLPIFGERVFPVATARLGLRRGGMIGMSLLMGARGVGALLGPLLAGYFLGREGRRMRLGILLGFLAAAVGYLALSAAPTLAWACAAVVLAHAGGSTIWVFSTTLLQQQTEDRYRGRVFSADYAFYCLSVSAVSYLAGLSIDMGLGVRTMAALTGAATLAPGLLWGMAQRYWREPAPDRRQ